MATGKNSTILIVDDDPSFYDILKQELSQYHFEECNNIKDAFQVVHSKEINAIIWDLALSEDYDYDQGLRNLPELIEITKGELPVIVATWDDRPSTYHNALDNGADCFLRKSDYNIEKWKGLIEKAIHLFQVNMPTNALKNVIDFVAASPSQLSIKKEALQLVTDSNSPILIEGEAGVGKNSLINYLLHIIYHNGVPIKKINAETISNYNFNLFFLGDSTNDGILRQTENGVLIIEKIESLDYASQLKLHNLLCKKEYQPLDTDYTLSIKSHFIFTIENELKILEGNFLKELYNQLSKIHLLPLRNRTEDIKPLINSFLKKKEVCPRISSFFGKNAEEVIETNVLDVLLGYYWIGNVRELREVIQRLIFIYESNFLGETKSRIDLECLMKIERFQEVLKRGETWNSEKNKAYEHLKQIQNVILKSDGNKKVAASLLGKSAESELELQVKKLYLEYEDLFKFNEFEAIRRIYNFPPVLNILICSARESRDIADLFRINLGLLEQIYPLKTCNNLDFLPGENIDDELKKRIENTNIFILFICTYFLNNHSSLLDLALNITEKKEGHVIPVLARPSSWHMHPKLNKLKVLPDSTKAISQYFDAAMDEALVEVVNKLNIILQNIYGII